MSVGLQILLCIVVLIITGLTILRIKTGSFNPRGIEIDKILSSVQNKSIDYSMKRYKKNLVRRNKNKFIVFYYKLVQGTLENLQLSSTVEWFTFIAIGVSIIAFALTFFLIQSVTVSVFTVLALLSAGITMLATIGKRKASVKLNAILDTTDLLCAYIDKGTQYAIEDNIDNIDPCIQTSFLDFLQSRKNGVLFDTAMKQLNKELGPAFDSFAHKAKIYEKERIVGMQSIFKDIVDDNAVTREMNIRKEITFSDMNAEFLIKFIILVVFVVFTYFNNPGMHYFMSQVNGKATVAISLVIVCLIFSYTQLQQLDLTFGGDR